MATGQPEMIKAGGKVAYQNNHQNGVGPFGEVDDATVKATGAHLEQFYKIIEKPLGQRRHIRIACLGAGYSGLMMAIVFSQRLQGKNAEFVIYERNEDLGGTWLENRLVSVIFSHSFPTPACPELSPVFILVDFRKQAPFSTSRFRYPGCKCDIPAHNYAFSFAPKPDWPNYYATSEQIHQYMHSVADQYDCNKYIKYNHSIKSAVWDESKAKWQVTIEKSPQRLTFVDEVDIFINAGGVLKYVSRRTIEYFTRG